ncbi:MAG: hypothetical protein GX100_13440 [candidate division WS1 bacterium]|nr:hypothetical protein [candidate division WS1 bacterium]
MSSQSPSAPTTLNPTLDPTGALSFVNPDTGNGWHGLRFYVLAGGRQLALQGAEIAPGVEAHLDLAPSATGGGWTVTPRLVNHSPADFTFTGYGFGVDEAGLGPVIHSGEGGVPLFGNSQNLRYELLPHSRPQWPFLSPLPLSPLRVGAQADGLIPALFLGESDGDCWLLEAALTQARHEPSWHLDLPSCPPHVLELRSEYTWIGGPETLAPGEEMTLETTLYQLLCCPPDGLFDAYMAELSLRHRFSGPDSRLDREPAFCTWNFGVFTNVNEALCLRRMDVVAELQGGGYFQLDHGYQRPSREPSGSPRMGTGSYGAIDVYYGNPEEVWDPERFPSGPQGFVSACRERGLRPALWLGMRVDPEGVIAREHPEWLLCDATGRPLDDVGHLCLDASVPEARAFTERMIHTVTADWGFEGIKLDFFSYMFDHPRAVFRHGGTNVTWKRWLLSAFREALGPHGYFLHCISCPLGNPFLAINGPDAYRAGIDIDSGEWYHHLYNVAWLLPALLATGKSTWYPNLDSCMGQPEIPVEERRSRNAFAYLSAGMLEFSGPVETFTEEMREEYRVLSRRCDQGGRVTCPDRPALFGRPLPQILVRHHAPDSRTRREFGASHTVGLFNWSDEPTVVGLPLAVLGLGAQTPAHDFWTAAPVELHEGALVSILPGRGHALVDLVPGDS